MTFKILTAIVFIAEIIISYTIFKKLLEIDKIILQTSETVVAVKPGMKDVGYLIKQISAQFVEFAYDFVSKIEKKRDDSIYGYLNKIVIALILLKINSKFLKKLLRSKHFKRLCKGFSMLKYMV